MKEIQKKIALLAAGLLAGYASAASDVVFSGVDNEKATKPAAYSYDYKDKIGSTVDSTNVNGTVIIDYSVVTTKDGYAGYGLVWKADDNWDPVVTSLAGYKGVCLTYKAEHPFRVDFKQFNIKDDNFYGAEVAAAADPKSIFIDFGSLEQGWKSTGTAPAWDAKNQLAIHFSYKTAHAKAAESATNTIELSRLVLADECETFAPELVGEAEGSETLNEGDTLKIDLSKIFADKDGDATVSVTPEINKNLISILGEKKGLALNSVVKIVPAKANLEGDATILLEAADALHKDTAKYELTITLVNVDNAPVAVNDAFTIEEDGKLVVKPEKSVIFNDYDIDDEEQTYDFTFALVDGVAHGTLTLDENEDGEYLGSFTYVPEENFNGTDFFTYTITDNTGKTSKPGKVTITVTPVNDPLIFTVLDEDFFKKVIELEEDFDPDTVESIAITSAIISLEDADGLGSLKKGVSSKNGIVSATVKELKGTYYINLEPVKDAHGDDVLTLYFKDDVDSVGVSFNVSVAAVADPPVALADAYEFVEDSASVVDVEKGVLANDYNPDDRTVALIAVLDEDAAKGKVELAEDGSFTYTVGKYTGKDSFTYHVETEDGEISEPVTVSITVAARNYAPVVKEVVLDTTISEDAAAIVIRKAIVESWAKDNEGDKITYEFSTESELVKVEYLKATGVLSITPVKNAFGTAEVIGEASDGNSSSTFKIVVKITAVNDAPVLVWKGTGVIDSTTGVGKIPMDSIFFDADGDSLEYFIKPNSVAIKGSVVNDTLVVEAAADSIKLYPNVGYRITVSATDGIDTTKTINVVLYLEGSKQGSTTPSEPNDSTEAINSFAAAPKATWQNAIAAERGAVSLMDMQGRVMWTRRLPVSESEVRAASAKVQGRKVLRVNSQTYTIK